VWTINDKTRMGRQSATCCGSNPYPWRREVFPLLILQTVSNDEYIRALVVVSCFYSPGHRKSNMPSSAKPILCGIKLWRGCAWFKCSGSFRWGKSVTYPAISIQKIYLKIYSLCCVSAVTPISHVTHKWETINVHKIVIGKPEGII